MSIWSWILVLVITLAMVGCMIVVVAKPSSTVILDWGIPLTVSGPSIQTHK